MRDLVELLAGHTQGAVRAMVGDGETRSCFGGVPELPPGVVWPERAGRRLEFLAQIDLTELQAAATVEWLPREGALLFFYDMEEMPWGFSPDDRDGWEVTLLQAGAVRVASHAPRPAPAKPGLLARLLGRAPAVLPAPAAEAFAAAHRAMHFVGITSYPGWGRPAVRALGLTEAECDALSELHDAEFGGAPQHQIGGLPAPVQNDDMELECQLASAGLNCGDSSAYTSPRRAALEAGAPEWRLLLQFDTDDALQVMWGDCGMLYFWVREADARAGDFSRVWMVLQCC